MGAPHNTTGNDQGRRILTRLVRWRDLGYPWTLDGIVGNARGPSRSHTRLRGPNGDRTIDVVHGVEIQHRPDT